jgi:multisubunit Na+/H+ antiporter MnhE subunit
MYNIIASVLTIIVAALLKWVFTQIGYELDELAFSALVAAIVVWFMTHFFTDLSVRGVRKVFKTE